MTGTNPDGPSSSTDSSANSSGNSDVTHNPERDPSDWVTGGEPSTGPQESYLSTLAKQAGEETPTGLTKAEASQEIERLQAETGRGTSNKSTDSTADASDSQAIGAAEPA